MHHWEMIGLILTNRQGNRLSNRTHIIPSEMYIVLEMIANIKTAIFIVIISVGGAN